MDPALVAAVTKGDYSTVKQLISHGTISTVDPSGEHILHIAGNCSNSKVIELLSSHWPSHINTANEDGITPLHVASMYGQLSAIKSLIENGADPFTVDTEGMTPLDYCVKEGHVSCVDYYQDLGIKPHSDEEIVDDSMAIAYTLMETTILGDSHDYDDTTLCYTVNDADVTLDLDEFTNSMLRVELMKMGEKPGPINDLTRGAYLRYLHKAKNGLLPPQAEETSNFKYELALCLSGTLPVPDFCHIEKELFSGNNSAKGNVRNCFNYLLIDPRITKQLPTMIGELQRFRIFVEAIFYIGKGQKDRPLQHLLDAKESQLAAPNKARSTKLQKIIDIWKENKGVVSVHCFHSALSAEAFVREGCMVEAIGLPNLTNIRRGQCSIPQWTIQKKRQYGVYLLHKAFSIYTIEGEQQIYLYNL